MLFLSAFLNVVYVHASAGIISASAFTNCDTQVAKVQIDSFSFSFSKVDKHLSFSIAGHGIPTSNVEATISISAYGLSTYSKSLNPCSREYNISSLCPMTNGPFFATGNVVIPPDVLSGIPALAFKVPDLSGYVTFTISASNNHQNLSCIRAAVHNGASLASPKAQAITGTIAGSTLFVSSLVSVAVSISTSASSAGIGLSSTTSATPTLSTSPNVGDVFLWFQAIGHTGALSLAYPKISSSFYQNFGWATGLIQWRAMQESIDKFRQRTGGNLTSSSVPVLDSSELSHPGAKKQIHSETTQTSSTSRKRAASDAKTSGPAQVGHAKIDRLVVGLTAFSERARIPCQNTFMTILVVFMILEASLILLSGLAKVVLDIYARYRDLPTCLAQFRENFWICLRTLLLRSLLVVYGTWCLFCLMQLKYGDSWAANLLAGTSLVVFTGVLVFLSAQVVYLALYCDRHGEKGRDLLFQHKPYLQKYGVLYDQFRTWWFFIPCIVYSLIKSLIIALGDRNGLFQIIGCISLEVLLLSLLCWKQAYDSRQANFVNIAISAVRLFSLFGTLLFVDVLELQETTKTVAGMAVIIVQSCMTGILAVLVISNALLPLMKKKEEVNDPKDEVKLGLLQEQAEAPASKEHGIEVSESCVSLLAHQDADPSDLSSYKTIMAIDQINSGHEAQSSKSPSPLVERT